MWYACILQAKNETTADKRQYLVNVKISVPIQIVGGRNPPCTVLLRQLLLLSCCCLIALRYFVKIKSWLQKYTVTLNQEREKRAA
ncbi:hypothetical protein C4513_14580 [Morganella morganii]|nr:hypothetical protein LR61_20725 [Morganella morganii]MQC09074.1 hypothetical protein [Morganella morganii]MQC12092.1 hypothetical protein [Morganella morganii]MQC16412.1 hypothetical protein [Morganella morganii]